MNTQTLKGDWKQLKGQVKEAFGKLTDDDLLMAEGNADQLVGTIQKRYGYTRDQAQQAWDSFAARAGAAVAHASDRLNDAASRFDPKARPDVPDQAQQTARNGGRRDY